MFILYGFMFPEYLLVHYQNICIFPSDEIHQSMLWESLDDRGDEHFLNRFFRSTAVRKAWRIKCLLFRML